jgi:hypothetical protein
VIARGEVGAPARRNSLQEHVPVFTLFASDSVHPGILRKNVLPSAISALCTYRRPICPRRERPKSPTRSIERKQPRILNCSDELTKISAERTLEHAWDGQLSIDPIPTFPASTVPPAFVAVPSVVMPSGPIRPPIPVLPVHVGHRNQGIRCLGVHYGINQWR